MQPTHVTSEYAVGTVAVRLTKFSCRSTICYEVPRLDRTRLSIVLDEVGGLVQARVDPALRYVRPHVRREVAILPPGARAWMFSDGIGMARALSLLFDWTELSALTGVSFGRQPRLRIAQHDACIFQLARLLATALEDEDSPAARVLGEHYTKTLVNAILLRAGGASLADPGERRRGLGRAQLRTVLQSIETDPQRPDIERLAQRVGLSQSQFYRAFKHATGETPYRWHLCARIRRAQVLLRESGAVIAQVASEAGFADQSHFTRTFKEIVGSTPRAWLRGANLPHD